MGEWSKKIGEYGEKVVERFFSIIGWNDLSSGVTLKCINSEQHLNDKGKPKETHGIDFFYSYISPLVSGQLNNIVISSKYKTIKYPNSPTKLFKEFMDDLITTLECFECSDFKNSILVNNPCSSINDIGVLFWLNNQSDSNDDLISMVSSARIDAIANRTIYIVDNMRIAFILEVMKYIKIMEKKYDYFFYYPNTGQNINPQNRQNTGKILPVEYLNSSIIPIKLVNRDNTKETCLFIATLNNFEEDDLIRLIGLSKDITTDLIGEVIIAFPDYEELNHRQSVTIAKQKFQSSEFTKIINVVNFNNSLNVF
ncbi:hypothetical protein [Dysgonomonas sp. HGC4]|uniref:GapS4a family protein n=1 Tax=Dysgonomonas sp. HGC4 TaxID=1658009 RepID=UPI000682BEBC|nr:hypothetical protein [Dysgonomonas sp. HGC4]MBD8347673.1 hypothetical protein [Dysgonomonas sp. HGC4]